MIKLIIQIKCLHFAPLHDGTKITLVRKNKTLANSKKREQRKNPPDWTDNERRTREGVPPREDTQETGLEQHLKRNNAPMDRREEEEKHKKEV